LNKATPGEEKVEKKANKASSMEAAAPLFGKLFLITILVSALGAACAFTLAFFNKKADNKEIEAAKLETE